MFFDGAEKGLEDYVRTALSKMLVASVGPATTEALEENGIHPDFEPSHPKMGVLVQETAERAQALLKGQDGERHLVLGERIAASPLIPTPETHGAVELKSSFGAIEASEIPNGIRAIPARVLMKIRRRPTGQSWARAVPSPRW